MTTTTPQYMDSRHLAEIIKREHSHVLCRLTSVDRPTFPPKMYVPSERMKVEKSRFTDIMHPYAELTFTEAKVLAIYMLTSQDTIRSLTGAEQVLTYIELIEDGDIDEEA